MPRIVQQLWRYAPERRRTRAGGGPGEGGMDSDVPYLWMGRGRRGRRMGAVRGGRGRVPCQRLSHFSSPAHCDGSRKAAATLQAVSGAVAVL